MRARVEGKLLVILRLVISDDPGSLTDKELERLEKHLDAFAIENYEGSDWKNE